MMRLVEERFWEKVDKRNKDECWEWIAFCDPAGYGRLKVGNDSVMAHRVSYQLSVGEIPNGDHVHVLHTCDNPSCVNPNHLYIGSDYENCLDRDKRGRHGTKKLNPRKVKEIRNKFKNGVTARELSKEYNVVKSNIYHILRNERWKWVK